MPAVRHAIEAFVSGTLDYGALQAELGADAGHGTPRDVALHELRIVSEEIGLSQALLNRDHHEVYYADCPPGPGGDPEAWKELEPIWTAIAAKVDKETGKAIEDGVDISVVAEGMEMMGAASVLYPKLFLKDVVMANVVVLILGFFASLSPAWRASSRDRATSWATSSGAEGLYSIQDNSPSDVPAAASRPFQSQLLQ